MPCLSKALAAALAASWLLPAAAVARPDAGTRDLRIVVHPKKTAKPRWKGYGFLPGYRQPPNLSDWRDRSVRYRGPYEPYEPRYWSNGRLLYGWGGAGFHRGRWNGGSFGPCWNNTPIGAMWNCGM